MRKTNRRRWLFNAGIAVLAAIIVFCLYKTVPEVRSQMKSAEVQNHVTTVIAANREDTSYPFSEKSWQALHDENTDFRGYLMFQSGLIEEPVVQSFDNEDYLHKAFDGEYDGAGTVFLDSRASLDSKNLTLYGHYVYYDSNSRFTPLEKLMDQEGYEDNQTVFLFLKGEVRTYLVSSVLFITEEEAEYYDYSCPDMTEFEYRDWIAYVNMKNLIDPVAGKVNEKDRLLTLQTCKKWDPSQRMLVICREISRLPY